MTKQKKFDVVKHVKAISRATIGMLPKAKVVPDKRKKAPRYKKLEEE